MVKTIRNSCDSANTAPSLRLGTRNLGSGQIFGGGGGVLSVGRAEVSQSCYGGGRL